MSVRQAVVLGSSPTALYVARELAAAGITVYVVDGDRQAAAYSRYVTAFFQRHPGPELLEELRRGNLRSLQGAMLFPTSDSWIEWLCRYAGSLSARFMFSSCYRDGLALSLLDKGRFAALCDEHGVHAPGCWIAPVPELRESARSARYPCLLKPTMIHLVRVHMGGKKLFIAQNEGQMQRLLQHISATDGDWMLQELVPGPESNITLCGGYFTAGGAPVQPFSCRKLRQYPPGFGSASLVRSEQQSEARTITENFLAALGFSGIAGAEFKYDERDGLLKIIEINPRPTLWFGLSHHCGKRIALAAFEDASGSAMPVDIEQRDSVVWRYLMKDCWSAAWYRLRGGISGLPPPRVDIARGSQFVGPLYDNTDLRPLWGEARNYLLKAVHRLGR